MPHSAIEQYMSKLEKHRAILRLILGEAAKVPHMDDEGRREWSRAIEDALYGDTPKRVSSPAMMKLAGIGVEVIKNG